MKEDVIVSMKTNKKRDIILLIILAITLINFIFVIALKIINDKNNNIVDDNNEEEIIEVTKEEVVSDKEESGVLFSDIRYIYDGENTIITMDITNKNNKTIKLIKYTFKIYDKDNNLIGDIDARYEKIIEINQILNDLEMGTNVDLTHAYSTEVEVTEIEFVEE